jgi:hypothetical protein
METFTESGIDYGRGKTNIDTETSIRYGVINSNKLSSYAWDEIMLTGMDTDYEEAMLELKQSLASAVKSVLQDYCTNFDQDEIADEIVDGLDIDYESTGDCRRFHYETSKVTFDTCSDGDIFVTKSEFYALCQFCSPCAPGAGWLVDPGTVRAYCLGPDWFDEGKMPYKCFRVSDDSEVTE